MNFIALIDLASIIVLVLGMGMVITRISKILDTDLKILLTLLLIATTAYCIFMFLEWMGISHSLNSVEDMTGAVLPIMWLFVLYAFLFF